MRACFLAAVLLSVVPLVAQPLSVGKPVPLSNTRYYEGPGWPSLESNDQELIVFWKNHDSRVLRAGRVSDAPQPGHPILRGYGGFDQIWTGNQFIAVAGGPQLRARFVEPNGEPRGEEIVVAGESARLPGIAFNGRIAMIGYGVENYPDPRDVRVVFVDAAGQPLRSPRIVATGTERFAVASNGREFVLVCRVAGPWLQLLRFDQNGTFKSERVMFSQPWGRIAIASDGRGYLLYMPDDQTALLLDAEGSIRRSLPLPDVSSAHSVSVTWSGDRWLLHTGWSIIEIDRDATTVLSREGAADLTDIGCIDGRCFGAFWKHDSMKIHELPLAAHEQRTLAAMQAPSQGLLTAVSSGDATLVLWREKRVGPTKLLRAGIRKRDGRWREFDVPMTIPLRMEYAIAASNGRGFVVVIDQDALLRFDEEGQLQSAKSFGPFAIFAIASNGRNYALVMENGMVRLLSPSGVLGDSVKLADAYFEDQWSIASNGEDFFVLRSEGPGCGIGTYCGSSVFAGFHLGPNLDRRAANRVYARNTGGSVVWTGTQYLALWSSGYETTIAGIDASGALRNIRKLDDAGMLDVSRTPSGVGVLTSKKEILLLDDGGRIIDRVPLGYDVPWLGWEYASQPLVELPGHSLAHFFSAVSSEPHQADAIRVMMSVASGALPPLAVGPAARAHFDGRTIYFDWDASPQPVNGYRVEYRIDDAEWTEIDRWFDPEDRTAAFVPPQGTLIAAMRVRAWNDAGTGAYSRATVVKTGVIPRKQRLIRVIRDW